MLLSKPRYYFFSPNGFANEGIYLKATTKNDHKQIKNLGWYCLGSSDRAYINRIDKEYLDYAMSELKEQHKNNIGTFTKPIVFEVSSNEAQAYIKTQLEAVKDLKAIIRKL